MNVTGCTDALRAAQLDNFVFLRGQVPAAPQSRELPSGDVLVSFRVTVVRPPGRPARSRRAVDSIDCQTTNRVLRQRLGRVQQGALVELTGAVQRRFWRSVAGPASRYSVEVDRLWIIPAGRQGGATRDRKPASA